MQATEGDRPLLLAGLLIFAAMIFDMLDGTAARWMRQSSRFGAELDSLCDAISFGVAPALIVMQITADYHPRILWVIAALFMACAVLRLARFNVETSDHAWFSGLPSPAAAATIASLAMIVANEPALMLPEAVRQLLPDEAGLLRAIRNAVPVAAVVLAALMVSRIRYPHLVYQWLHSKRHFQHVTQGVFALAAIVALGAWAAPLVLLAFVVASPFRAAVARACRTRAAPGASSVEGSATVEQPATATPASATLSPGNAAAPAPGRVPLHERARGLRLWWPTRPRTRRRRA
jgi:CDP-diacylglycerol--serine O-phosphatidyltransferase